MPIAELDNVGKPYGTLEALNGVAVQIERGELLALLGPNGRKQDLPRSTFSSDSAVDCSSSRRLADGGPWWIQSRFRRAVMTTGQ